MKKILLIILVILLFLILFPLIFFPFLIIFLLPIIFIAILLWVAYVLHKIHIKFMQDYAQRHGLTYQKNADIKEFGADLFSIGHSKRIANVLEGEHDSYPVKIFNYAYTVGSGENQATYNFTVLEVEIEKTIFPYILLQSRRMPRIIKIGRFFDKEKEVKISLEKDYKKHFKLYCTQDYEIEVLQIFTEELLDYLLTHKNKFSIEFSKNKMYFYINSIVKKEEQMDELYDLVKKVLKKIGPLLKRLHDDFDAMHLFYNRSK